MLLFVGKTEKGFFTEERETVIYIEPELHIEAQAEQILPFKEQAETIVYDIEQYADEPECIVSWIKKIEEALRVRTIIFAPGFSPKSTLIHLLWDAGIKNFIFSIYLADQKEDLEFCLSGYYENFGYEEKRGISFSEEKEEEEAEEKEKTRTIGIGVAGCIGRMGTTTQAIQFVKYLQYQGARAAYFQMNGHGFVEALKEAYEEISVEEELGCVTYAGVDMFYRPAKLQEVMKLDYDYLVFDYGVVGENGFNKISFLEKEKQIFVVGSKPGGEFEKTYEVIKNHFYNNVYYIYNFVSAGEQEDIKELMGEKEEVTFFTGDTKDPFIFCGMDFYGNILSLEEKTGKEKKEKRKRWGRRQKGC